jgi:hypothetical protein
MAIGRSRKILSSSPVLRQGKLGLLGMSGLVPMNSGRFSFLRKERLVVTPAQASFCLALGAMLEMLLLRVILTQVLDSARVAAGLTPVDLVLLLHPLPLINSL